MSQIKKTAIVTGAAGGLGLATVKAFLAEGFNVVMYGSNADRLAAFRAHYEIDESIQVIGGYAGRLGGREELVQLLRAESNGAHVLEDRHGTFRSGTIMQPF